MKYCSHCGAEIGEDDRYCSACGLAVSSEAAGEQAVHNAATEEWLASEFTGGALANFFVNLLALMVSIITLSLAYPAMLCWKMRWEQRHTFLNGRRLAFDGKGMQLFGRFLLWVLLSIVTFGIFYIFFMAVAMEKWKTKHIHFEGTENLESVFNGNSLQLLGVNLLTWFITVITFTLGSYWAHCYQERWYSEHKVIDGCGLYFDGKAMQYFGKCLLWWFLTIITLGIFSFWKAVKQKKWTVSHTKVKAGCEIPISIMQEAALSSTGAESQKKCDGLGIGGFVTAICSLLFSILPGFSALSIVGIALATVGVVLSSISVSRRGYPIGLAIAGVVIGSISLALYLISILMRFV